MTKKLQIHTILTMEGWEPQYHGGQLWAYTRNGETKYPHELPQFDKSEDFQEMEGKLSWDEAQTYEEHLLRLLRERADAQKSGITASTLKAYHATGDMKRRAYILTLWKEDQPKKETP